MTCNCMIDLGPGNSECEVPHGKMIKSDKLQKCCECEREIQPGESYEAIDDMENHDEYFITCSDCLVARDVFFSRCYAMRGMWKAVFCEFDDFIPESCLSKLTPYHRDRLCEKIEDEWRYMEDI